MQLRVFLLIPLHQDELHSIRILLDNSMELHLPSSGSMDLTIHLSIGRIVD
jgi:hypothetical protein